MYRLILLASVALTASVNLAAANPKIPTNEVGLVESHSAVVDMPQTIDLSRADPTTWPIPPSRTSTPVDIKGLRYFDENRFAGE